MHNPLTARLGPGPAGTSASRKVTLLGLIAATYFMVSGGPYGLEDVIAQGGYAATILAILIVPFTWALPTTLMVSELASAIPQEGGYYIWVRRALGPFWGFQEAWLSLAASIFDMAIYPILFVTYLGYIGNSAGLPRPDFWSALAGRDQGVAGLLIGAAMVAVCAAANLRPARSVGRSSAVLLAVLLGPFVLLCALAVIKQPGAPGKSVPPAVVSYIGALIFAMWNYMGWDNASTFAGEVERPQRTYPLAMAGAVSLVALNYLVPVLATLRTGMGSAQWKTGAWVEVGQRVGGTALAVAVGVGGVTMAFGTFNSLVLSYTRLPVVLAEDGYLPRVFTRRLRSGAPWVAVVVCSLAWATAAQLGLKRVLALDVMVWGLSMVLEFAALVVLRVREPALPRPFRVPGGTLGTVLLGLLPTLLLALAIFDQARKWEREEGESLSPAAGVLLGAALAVLGVVVYYLAGLVGRQPGTPSKPEPAPCKD